MMCFRRWASSWAALQSTASMMKVAMRMRAGRQQWPRIQSTPRLPTQLLLGSIVTAGCMNGCLGATNELLNGWHLVIAQARSPGSIGCPRVGSRRCATNSTDRGMRSRVKMLPPIVMPRREPVARRGFFCPPLSNDGCSGRPCLCHRLVPDMTAGLLAHHSIQETRAGCGTTFLTSRWGRRKGGPAGCLSFTLQTFPGLAAIDVLRSTAAASSPAAHPRRVGTWYDGGIIPGGQQHFFTGVIR